MTELLAGVDLGTSRVKAVATDLELTVLGEIVAAGQPVGRVDDNAPEELRGAVLTVAGHDHQTAAAPSSTVSPPVGAWSPTISASSPPHPTGITLERIGTVVGAATPAARIELGRQAGCRGRGDGRGRGPAW